MPLPASFDTLDAIPEAFRSGYVEREGKFVLDDSDVAGLKASQRTLLAEKKAAAEERDRLKAIIGDRKPEDVAALLKAHADSEEERQKKAGDFDKLLEKRVNETKAEYERRITELAPYKEKYEDRELDLAIRESAGKAKVIAEDMKAVIKLVKGDRVRLDATTGKPIVVDEDGDVTGLTLDKFFAETFRAEYPKFYQPAGGSGGGSAGGSGGSGSRSAHGTVDATDNAAMLANLDAIATGKIKVNAAA